MVIQSCACFITSASFSLGRTSKTDKISLGIERNFPVAVLTKTQSVSPSAKTALSSMRTTLYLRKERTRRRLETQVKTTIFSPANAGRKYLMRCVRTTHVAPTAFVASVHPNMSACITAASSADIPRCSHGRFHQLFLWIPLVHSEIFSSHLFSPCILFYQAIVACILTQKTARKNMSTDLQCSDFPPRATGSWP